MEEVLVEATERLGSAGFAKAAKIRRAEGGVQTTNNVKAARNYAAPGLGSYHAAG